MTLVSNVTLIALPSYVGKDILLRLMSCSTMAGYCLSSGKLLERGKDHYRRVLGLN